MFGSKARDKSASEGVRWINGLEEDGEAARGESMALPFPWDGSLGVSADGWLWSMLMSPAGADRLEDTAKEGAPDLD
jgi:hypothetical protein